MKRILFLASLVLALGACSTTSPDVISRDQAQRLQQVQDGTLLAVRPVVVDGSQSGIGGVTGGVVGGVAGSSVGGGRGAVIASVLGAVAGGAVGNTVERRTTQEQAVELLVQLRNGERRMVVQALGDQVLTPGDAILLVTSGGKTRVVKAR